MSDYQALRDFTAKNTNSAVVDPRFVNTNRTRQCWVHYADYFRCVAVRGQNGKYTEVCDFFKTQYKNTCPPAWLDAFDEQRAEGHFPASIYSLEPADSKQ